MLSGLFAASTSASAVKHFAIRLNSSFIVLRGSDQAASSALLQGVLVLCLAESLKVHNIHLRLTGTCRVAWHNKGRHTRRMAKDESIFYEKDWIFADAGKNKIETLPAGNYEYPFTVTIPGDTPESVEGLESSWIVYRMRASIDRGKFAHHLHTRKHLRIVRTLDAHDLALSHEMSIDNFWADKLDYHLSTPSKAVVFGSTVKAVMRLSPLDKGISISSITLDLEEIQDFRMGFKRERYKRIVSSKKLDLVEDLDQPFDEEAGVDGWRASHELALPKSLKECLQDTDCLGIRIRHRLNFNIQMLSLNGVSSELRASLPVAIFISPQLPIGDNNIVSQNLTGTQALRDLGSFAPPLYGEHQFDQLYSDIDPSGFITPAAIGESGMNTPRIALSRNVSSEALQSHYSPRGVPVAPSALSSRLQNLPDIGSHHEASKLSSANRTNERTPSGSSYTESGPPSPGRDSDHSSNPLSRRGSEERRVESPDIQYVHKDLDPVALSQVPSYFTAITNDSRTPISVSLPHYNVVVVEPLALARAAPHKPALAAP
ncbi:MAG: hypothetical protein M1829_000587 [Trizodia sp. TS-e1964]|nr:MAG: hypothetical protein M1829_000587 [Trizodia sp. TS-e1964]